MDLIKDSCSLLNDILFKQCSFLYSTKEYFDKNNLEKSARIAVISYINAELKHHLVLSNFLKEKGLNLSNEEITAVLFSIGNLLFANSLTKKDIESFIKKNFKDNSKDLLDVIYSVNSKEELYLDKNGKQYNRAVYLSYRYNIPGWVCKLWKNHFGIAESFKMYQGVRAIKGQYVSVKNINNTNYQLDMSKYEETSIDGLFKYVGKEPLKDQKEYITRKIFLNKPAIKDALNSIDLDLYKPLAIYSDYDNNVLFNVINSTYKNANIEYMTNNPSNKLEMINLTNSLSLENVHVYECSPKGVLTCVSNQVNSFIIFSRGTYLDALSYQPDFFLSSDNMKMNEYINNEKSLLTDAATLVEKGGTILYVIPTANLKEGHLLIEEFLSSHPELTLIKEKQFLPSDIYHSSYYYAVIRKILSNED